MKPLYLSLLFTASLSGSLMYVSHAKTVVKYSQIFAEKKITFAETFVPDGTFGENRTPNFIKK